jgi:hypothetical protein
MLDTAIDLDDNGVAGTVPPNGEFSVLLPEPTHPITITAALDAPEDTRDLGGGIAPAFRPWIWNPSLRQWPKYRGFTFGHPPRGVSTRTKRGPGLPKVACRRTRDKMTSIRH